MENEYGDFEEIKEEVTFGKFVKFTREQYDSFCKIHGKPRVDEIIQSIDDCLLLAGIITFFSAIPLFFLSRK